MVDVLWLTLSDGFEYLGYGAQIRPKMILTLTASIMLWSLANKVITKVADASAAAGKWAVAMQKIDASNKLGKVGHLNGG